MQKKSHENQRTAEGAYRFGDFDLYPSERQLHHEQKPVSLPPKVFDALLLFVRNAERLVRRDELNRRVVARHVRHRCEPHQRDRQPAQDARREAIQTVSKFGYRFTLKVVGEPGIDQGAYATFLRARELATFRSLDSMTSARDLFSLCVAEDPMFAAAWAWLGRCSRFLEKFKAGPSINLDLAQAALRRALAIDPHLACAHHFYTQLQVDLGESREAAVRLTQRLAHRGGEPESFAGLVHALRFCGLLDESVSAHERATALDPTMVTSVPHTHFLRGEYETTLDTYGATRYYLDAAAWAALGDRSRAATLLQERLAGSAVAADGRPDGFPRRDARRTAR
jgi:tetratricopeptide (TPR) repeat protein